LASLVVPALVLVAFARVAFALMLEALLHRRAPSAETLTLLTVS
jgi:hypothetical protein